MKNFSRVFRLASLVLSAVLLGCSTSKEQEEHGTKILMIGNSFSICLLKHLPQVAADRGVELDLASLYIGGCSLKRHWENAARDGDEDFKPYRFGRNRYGAYTQGKANVCEALRMEKWDIVTIQQASHESWKPESYHPYGDKLIASLRHRRRSSCRRRGAIRRGTRGSQSGALTRMRCMRSSMRPTEPLRRRRAFP